MKKLKAGAIQVVKIEGKAWEGKNIRIYDVNLCNIMKNWTLYVITSPIKKIITLRKRTM